MREIKFRVWDKIDGKIREVTLIDFEYKKVKLLNDYTGESYLRDFEEVILLEYTGLRDKTEKEIYEGDIVEIGDFIYFIKFEIGSFMLVRCSDGTDMYTEFDNCWNDDVYPLCQLHWESNADEDILYNCEVIGNIYNNPGLLNA